MTRTGEHVHETDATSERAEEPGVHAPDASEEASERDPRDAQDARFGPVMDELRDGEWVERTVMNPDTGLYESSPIPLREAYEQAVARLHALEQFNRGFEMRMWRKQWKRGDEFQEYTASVFRATLDNATRTYRLATTMSEAMFVVGIGLFIFSAVYATFAEEKTLSLLFAGLGVGTFVAIFVLGPIDQVQTALSNLVQVEVVFMAFFEQLRMLSAYPWKTDDSLDRKRAERASQLLHEHADGTMALLERYLEADSKQRGEKTDQPSGARNPDDQSESDPAASPSADRV